ncbi:Glycoside hydrolase family 47 [Penicillium maclennaniae]|uniref:Glycoside hydrolase family 47 n=1 Tax=Penicillium maclennaniae TaxID=1343394 RepID=UPI0025424E6D|nr:Glycoside hydrolase family 47 [Penicillium maclennaniae]KAJ5665981.1 Glycoside hydrolase family 47 [Penicillium maclennaniae]
MCLSVLIGVSALVAALFLDNPNIEAALGYFRLENRDSYWEKHREEVKDVFVTSWDAYSKYAFEFRLLRFSIHDGNTLRALIQS